MRGWQSITRSCAEGIPVGKETAGGSFRAWRIFTTRFRNSLEGFKNQQCQQKLCRSQDLSSHRLRPLHWMDWTCVSISEWRLLSHSHRKPVSRDNPDDGLDVKTISHHKRTSQLLFSFATLLIFIKNYHSAVLTLSTILANIALDAHRVRG